jgi:alcohol dehydrogenase class IV
VPSSSSPAAPFRWQDGERVVAFGRGAAISAAGELGDGFVLLSTERAVASAPEIAERAARVHLVRSGRVDEIAAELLPEVDGELIAGLGGGRVIDTAKAIAAARGSDGVRVAAIPTTLSGAEMTRVHRHAAGVAADTKRVRPAVVINDPVLSASQELPGLAASALNALGHAAEAPLTPFANPVSTLAALDGAGRVVSALQTPEDPDRDELALGALLAGYAIDSAIYGLHHVLSQTLARHGGIGHGTANAIMLPHSLRALASRFPDRLERFGEALGGDPIEVAARLVPLTGATRLQDAGVEHDALEHCAEEAAERAELGLTPPAADAEELLGLYESAW